MVSHKYKKITIQDRERIISLYNGSTTPKAISVITKLPLQTIYTIIQRNKREGRISLKSRGGNKRSVFNEEKRQFLFEIIDQNPLITLKNMADQLQTKFNHNFSKSGIFRTLKVFHFSLKTITTTLIQRNTESTKIKRQEYERKFNELQYEIEPNQLIFIDEVGFSISLRTKKGRAKIGESVYIEVNGTRNRNFSVIAASNKNGMILHINNFDSVNGLDFVDFLHALYLKCVEIGITAPVFVMDNARIHHFSGVLALQSELNFKILYLPPYSPFLNIIESCFSKWKNYVCRCQCNSQQDLLTEINNGFTIVTPEDCEGFYRKMIRYMPRCRDFEDIFE